jgi:hypothetical protein
MIIAIVAPQTPRLGGAAGRGLGDMIHHHGLEKAELEFVFSITAPLFWILRDSNGNEMIKNGSLFFMDAGKGVFAVTASHVVDECLNDIRSPMFVQCMIGGHGPGRTMYLHLRDRVIDAHSEIDIATLHVSRAEVESTGRTSKPLPFPYRGIRNTLDCNQYRLSAAANPLEKIALDLQLADLAVQIVNDLQRIPDRRRLVATRKQLARTVHQLLLPAADHRRMNPKLSRQLSQGLLPRKCRHRHSRLEFRAMLLPLYAHVARPFGPVSL